DYYGAVASHRRSVSLDPDNARGHSLLGAALAKVGKPAEAMPHVRRAVEREPNNGPMHNNLGYVLQVAGQFDEALAEYDQAIALGPQQANMFANRASCLDQLGRLPDAVEAAEKGAAAFPNDPNFPSNISVLCRRLRDYPTAIRWAERALKIQPGMSDAHGNLALALLSAGDYARGWVEYEWRWRSPTFTSPARDFRQPLWDGSDAAGRTILVHAEQGFGDTIQFMRYVPMLIERGAKVIVECHYALLPMVRRIEGLHKTVAAGLALPDFDVHAPLLSLPRAFGTTLDSIPSTVPYLTIDAQRIKAWREKIPRERFNVGITWAGNRKPDPSRNISPELLLPLRDVAGIRLFGLQKRDAETYSPPPPELEMVDLSSELSDFAETGSAMRAMDLVLTIDSAAAHLAGAIGAKVWTFVPWAPDWRWMLDRDDSPWYPTMRLFRQTTAGDWPSVIRRVVDELRKISSA
ncbi:MAG: tetratricopeptide repeat protein, partial [Tepidisphaeraceae bacterium]